MLLLNYTNIQRRFFKVEEWLKEHTPKRKLKGGIWDDVHGEYEFKRN